jgi:hypothetical protein
MNSPPFQGGVDAPSRNIPVPLKGADGAVAKFENNSVRFAIFYKVASPH